TQLSTLSLHDALPISNSLAVDGGNDAVAPSMDQRHQPRTGLHADIGAFEYNGPAAQPGLAIRLLTNNAVVVSWSNTFYTYSLQRSEEHTSELQSLTNL